MNSNDLTGRFGARLREFREMRGFSQEALADAAGIHRTHISLIERNKRAIRLDTLFRLASALGVDAADLVRGLGIPPPSPGLRSLSDFDRLLPFIRQFQELASRHGIDDIFQDNGGKRLQALLVLKLHRLERREGNDAVDDEGREYELKSVNIRLTRSFSTHRHLNLEILKKYRTVEAWYFSIYEDIELRRIYKITPAGLEPYFQKWEGQWQKNEREGKGDLNNPKIPVTFVEEHGTLVYPTLSEATHPASVE